MTMADKAKLQGSFGSLLDTLNNRFDPLQPGDIVASWTSTMARCAACARNIAGWDSLAGNSAGYDAPIEAIDDATRALVTTDYGDAAAVRNALQLTANALSELEAVFA
jgi:hypothetical protein